MQSKELEWNHRRSWYLFLMGSSLILGTHFQKPVLAQFHDQSPPLVQAEATPIPAKASIVSPEDGYLLEGSQITPTQPFSHEQPAPALQSPEPALILTNSFPDNGLTEEQVNDRHVQDQFLASDPTQTPDGSQVDLSPAIIQGSPVLQRWLKQVPDVSAVITNFPSFRSRLRVGYSQFPSSGQLSGWNIGFEDIFVGETPLTISGNYSLAFDGQRQAWGTDLHYYLRPLGSYVNVAPVVGYQNLRTSLYNTDGVNVGLRLLVVLSRGGGADLVLTQTWLAPGTDREVGLTTFSAGYALTSKLRLSADIQQQNAPLRQDSRLGIALEWLL